MIDTHHTREAWLAQRHTFIGASEAAMVLGKSPWGGPMKLYAQKTDVWEDPDEDEAEYLRVGRFMELTIGALYEDETARPVYPNDNFTIHRHPDYPFIAATLDATTTPESDDDAERIYGVPNECRRGCLEMKNVAVWMQHHWAEGIPVHVQIQVQHQMLCSGLTWGSVAALIGGNRFVWADVRRNDFFIDNLLLPSLIEFWDRVERRDPPPPDASQDDMKAMGFVYEHAEQETVALNGDMLDVLDSWQAAKEDKADATQREAMAKAQILHAMKGAAIGTLPDGSWFSHKEQQRGKTSFPVLRHHTN